jgi:formylglycine-generating enzyme required for sulfatase activity
MSGNVWEWTAACEGGAAPSMTDKCRLRGGSFWDPENDLYCAADFVPGSLARTYSNKNHGVRCCADAE